MGYIEKFTGGSNPQFNAHLNQLVDAINRLGQPQIGDGIVQVQDGAIGINVDILKQRLKYGGGGSGGTYTPEDTRPVVHGWGIPANSFAQIETEFNGELWLRPVDRNYQDEGMVVYVEDGCGRVIRGYAGASTIGLFEGDHGLSVTNPATQVEVRWVDGSGNRKIRRWCDVAGVSGAALTLINGTGDTLPTNTYVEVGLYGTSRADPDLWQPVWAIVNDTEGTNLYPGHRVDTRKDCYTLQRSCCGPFIVVHRGGFLVSHTSISHRPGGSATPLVVALTGPVQPNTTVRLTAAIDNGGTVAISGGGSGSSVYKDWTSANWQDHLTLLVATGSANATITFTVTVTPTGSDVEYETAQLDNVAVTFIDTSVATVLLDRVGLSVLAGSFTSGTDYYNIQLAADPGTSVPITIVPPSGLQVSLDGLDWRGPGDTPLVITLDSTNYNGTANKVYVQCPADSPYNVSPRGYTITHTGASVPNVTVCVREPTPGRMALVRAAGRVLMCWMAISVFGTYTSTTAYGLTSDGAVWKWGKEAHDLSGEFASAVYGKPKYASSSGTTDRDNYLDQISVSGSHGMGIRGRTLYQWGTNTSCEYGCPQDTNQMFGADSTGMIISHKPLASYEGYIKVNNVPLGLMGRQVEAAQNATAYLDATGVVWTWGKNNLGQLGNGGIDTGIHPAEFTSRIKINGSVVTNVTKIFTNHNATFAALTSTGQIITWGCHSDSLLLPMLGRSGTRETPGYVTVSGVDLTGVVDLAIGDTWMIAVKSDGTVLEWGIDTPSGLATATPTQVTGIDNVVMVAAGLYHALALRTDGSVWAWGGNGAKQLGDVEYTAVGSLRTPQRIQSCPPCRYVAAGGNVSYAIGVDGIAWCWGLNDEGGLGSAGCDWALLKPIRFEQVPKRLSNLTTSGRVFGGCNGAHLFAVDGHNRLWSWGRNSESQQLPDDGRTLMTPFVYGSTATLDMKCRIVSAAAGEIWSVVIDEDGYAYTFGTNLAGECGNGTAQPNPDYPVKEPYRLTDSSSVPIHRAKMASCGGYMTVDAVENYHFSLLLTEAGELYAWGKGGKGCLAQGNLNDSLWPIRCKMSSSSLLSDVVHVAAGGTHAVAALKDGRVVCWGKNDAGQLGNGTETDSTYPVFVVDANDDEIDGVIEVAAGDAFSLALKEDGTVWGWGTGAAGELGNPAIQIGDGKVSHAVQVQMYADINLSGGEWYEPLRDVKKIAATAFGGLAIQGELYDVPGRFYQEEPPYWNNETDYMVGRLVRYDYDDDPHWFKAKDVSGPRYNRTTNPHDATAYWDELPPNNYETDADGNLKYSWPEIVFEVETDIQTWSQYTNYMPGDRATIPNTTTIVRALQISGPSYGGAQEPPNEDYWEKTNILGFDIITPANVIEYNPYASHPVGQLVRTENVPGAQVYRCIKYQAYNINPKPVPGVSETPEQEAYWRQYWTEVTDTELMQTTYCDALWWTHPRPQARQRMEIQRVEGKKIYLSTSSVEGGSFQRGVGDLLPETETPGILRFGRKLLGWGRICPLLNMNGVWSRGVATNIIHMMGVRDVAGNKNGVTCCTETGAVWFLGANSNLDDNYTGASGDGSLGRAVTTWSRVVV